jgi:hypothetical protein
MAEDRVDAREISWRQLLPWTEIFRGFGVALDLNKLLLAAAGIVVTWLGWSLLALIVGSFYGSQPNWPGQYHQQFPASDEEAYLAFKHDRQRWNLMHETTGAGKTVKFEVGDIAETFAEYELVTNAVGTDPNHYNLEALNKLEARVGDKPTATEHLLEVAKVNRFKALLGKEKPEGRLAASPWSEDRGPNPYLLLTGQAGVPWEAGRAGEWFVGQQFPVLIEPLIKLMRPLIYFLSPRADWPGAKFYFLLVFVWTVGTWSLFGGAITRIAVVQVARPNEPIGLTDAVRFTLKRYLSYFAAPLFPIALVFVLLVFSAIFSLFHMIPLFGDIFVDGLLWFVMLLIGLVMALSLVGLAVGWPLMAPTISAEGTDSWEALSRSFSYVFQRPWHYLWYASVAVAYGAVVIFFVGFMGSLTVYLSKWAVSNTTWIASREPSYLFVYAPESFGWRTLLLEGAKVEFDENKVTLPLVVGGTIDRVAYDRYVTDLNWWNKAGAGLVAVWLGLLFLLILGFGYSFFFSTTTIIYLLMRRSLDASDMDEVYLEEGDPPGFAGSITPAAPEPTKSSQSLQMVEAPSLRSVTPPSANPPPFTPAPTPAATIPASDVTAVAPPPPATPAAPTGDGTDTSGLPPI